MFDSLLVRGWTPLGAGIATPEPDASSPLQITGVSSTNDGRQVTVRYGDCPVGASYSFDVSLVELRSGKGHKLPPAAAHTSADDFGICDGSDTFGAVVMDSLSSQRVAVWATVWWEDPAGNFGYASNSAEIRLRGRG